MYVSIFHAFIRLSLCLRVNIISQLVKLRLRGLGFKAVVACNKQVEVGQSLVEHILAYSGLPEGIHLTFQGLDLVA